MARGAAEPIKATMKTELTEDSIKTFFFEQVQKKLLQETMAKKRKATKRSEVIPQNWKGKRQGLDETIQLSTFQSPAR
jgi:predicted naringenin-chalcone synthase